MTEKTEAPLPASAGSETTAEEDMWNDFEAMDAKAGDEAADAPEVDDFAGGENSDDAEARADEGDTDQNGSGDEGGQTDAAEVVDWKSRAEETEHKWRSEQGRAEGQRRKAERLQKELEQARQQLAALKSDETKAQDRESRLTKIREEYGDVINPVLEEISDLRARDDALTKAEQSRLTALETDYDDMVREQEALFLQDHSDGFDFIDQNRDTFRQWIDDQPREMRDIFKANASAIVDGQGAAMMVSRFKAFVQDQSQGANPGTSASSETRPSSRRKLQLEGARSSRTTGRQAATSDISPDTDDPEALWEYWDRKERSAR